MIAGAALPLAPPMAARAHTSYGLDLHTLNPPQREAVLHSGSPVLVLAGAGSGKTRVITYRIARILAEGTDPATILGLTFTNKAAKEMRERLGHLVGARAGEVQLATFHALGLSILKKDYEAAGLKRGFTIYDTSDQLGLVRELARGVKIADRRLDTYKLLELILAAKRKRLEELAFDSGDDYEFAAYDLYPRYVEQMRAFNALDFDDLLLRTMDVLAQPEPRERWGRTFEHLLVDEYQDTSPDQLELLRILGANTREICAVGDDDQSIYAWRGAASDNILAFERDFPGTHEVVLAQNYRSTSNVLACANAVITNNKKRKAKELWSAHGDGAPVELVACTDAEDEATFVAEQIGALVYEGARHDDIAVLYRSNTQCRAFEEALGLEQIPYRIVGGQSFFDKKEVRDALAYLAVLHNPRDEVALRRIVNVPPRGIGPTSLERLVQHGEHAGRGLAWALQHAHEVAELPKNAVHGAQELATTLQVFGARMHSAGPQDLAHHARELIAHLKLKDAILAADDHPTLVSRRLENLEQVAGGLERFAQRARDADGLLAEYLRSAALDRKNEDEDEASKGQVTLMTLHSSKGLEFPFVFLVGVEEDLLPHKRTIEEAGDLSEERRLCYVGITRAKKRLWMTHARARLRHGKLEPRTPSRFLDEIGDIPAVRRWQRDAPPSEEQADVAADDFFKKMRAQLGIE